MLTTGIVLVIVGILGVVVTWIFVAVKAMSDDSADNRQKFMSIGMIVLAIFLFIFIAGAFTIGFHFLYKINETLTMTAYLGGLFFAQNMF